MQQENGGLPLMVHIGNNPPDLDEIADLLTSGDIITHCYNGKPNRILTPSGELKSSITRALQRGVRLDIGHGTASFSFEVARRAIAMGILPHTISSDILPQPYRRPGALAGAGDVEIPRHRHVAAAGHRLRDRQRRRRPASDHKGRLEVGYDADLTLFTLAQTPTVLVDAEKESLQTDKILLPLAAVRAGKGYLTEQGSAENAFDF
jgi:dihydroorotase